MKRSKSHGGKYDLSQENPLLKNNKALQLFLPWNRPEGTLECWEGKASQEVRRWGAGAWEMSGGTRGGGGKDRKLWRN